jgi:hypothetical protein
MVRMTVQVLCELLRSPNGFILSVLSANLTFCASLPNLGNMALKFVHCLPSEGCRSLPSSFV